MLLKIRKPKLAEIKLRLILPYQYQYEPYHLLSKAWNQAWIEQNIGSLEQHFISLFSPLLWCTTVPLGQPKWKNLGAKTHFLLWSCKLSCTMESWSMSEALSHNYITSKINNTKIAPEVGPWLISFILFLLSVFLPVTLSWRSWLLQQIQFYK